MRLPTETEWPGFLAALDERGYAVLPGLLDPEACGELAALYDHAEAFRSRVVMAHHNFGRGEYQYLRYPLPPVVAALREALYPALVPLANQWHERLRLEPRFPATLAAYLAYCHAAGQQRPTPLILKYEEGDYNCLHQDLYGDFVFPVQATILLSAPGRDFAGGEFMLVEQRPRMQSRARWCRSARATRSSSRSTIARSPARAASTGRGCATASAGCVPAGRRFTLGIIFHDAA